MMLTITVIALASVTMLVLATIMGAVLGWANRAFHVEVDPRVVAIDDALPAANCGGCGFVGCTDYAEAVVHEGAGVDLCAPGGSGVTEAIAEIMGVEVEQSWPYRAVVHCAATWEKRLLRHPYQGEPTCAAANLIADVQGCTYGCLGLADCEQVCDYDAIHVVEGLARVDYEECTGCGACIDACPRHIISRIPFKAELVLVVACSNKDFGAEVKQVCRVGCIGCKACSRFSDLIQIEENLPTLDYDQYDPVANDFTQSLQKCPMESLVWVGKPTAADLAAVAEEELPDRIEAEFETTVDQAEWRG